MQKELDRRKPGSSRHVTQRRESDTVEILSGVYEGRTTGTAIGFLVRNEDQRSKDYAAIAEKFRPGHADYTYWQKYGMRDARGGGRASARETVVRVAAGAIAKKWLKAALRRRGARLSGAARIDQDRVQELGVDGENPFFCARSPGSAGSWKNSWTSCARAATRAARASTSSPPACRWAGASRCTAGWMPTSPGAMMSINAVKGVEIGAGFAAIEQKGSEHGDEMTPEGFASNNNGGVLGGISTGQDVTVSLALKPTSSIRLPRRTIDVRGNPTTIETTGRHDPCVGIRATPIAEAMLACVLMDHALRHRAQCADVVAAAPRVVNPRKIN